MAGSQELRLDCKKVWWWVVYSDDVRCKTEHFEKGAKRALEAAMKIKKSICWPSGSSGTGRERK